MVMDWLISTLKDLYILGWSLAASLLIVIIIIHFLYSSKGDDSNVNNRNQVSKQTHNNLINKKMQVQADNKELRDNIKKLQNDNDTASMRIENYQQEINKLKAENARQARIINELNEIIGRPQAPMAGYKPSMSEFSTIPDFDDNSKEQLIVSKETIMYASFPRNAENSIYFSELTQFKNEESYFELRVSKETGKATFKPINFLQIRNYDSAMSVIQPEGAKPNVAEKVIGVEPGTAHLEGNDWFIDSLVKIKLA